MVNTLAFAPELPHRCGMSMLTIEQIATHAARGWWGRAGLPPPNHGPLQWSAAAARILFDYGTDPLAPIDIIAHAEGLVVAWAAGTGTCGASVGRLLLVPPAKSPGGRWLAFQHERTHVHVRRFLDGANESDVWGMTLELAMPRSLPRATLARMLDAPEPLKRLRAG